MAKSVSKKKQQPADTKSPAAYASTAKNAIPSESNSSKYKPGADVDMSLQALDPVDGLRKLFVDGIKELYWAEMQLTKALPKIAKATSSADLVDAILNHLQQTTEQVTRLESVFEMLGVEPQAKKCDAMEALIKEGEAIIENTDAGTPARDLGIVMASRKVEHHEIACYTGLIKLGEGLDMSDVVAVLSDSLSEEQDSDDLLGNIGDVILSSRDENEAGE